MRRSTSFILSSSIELLMPEMISSAATLSHFKLFKLPKNHYTGVYIKNLVVK
jgi:hypothetical protein